MASTDPKAGEPTSVEEEYVDLAKFRTNVDKKFIDDTGLPAKILYYCRDCKTITKPKRVGKKFQFSCEECKGKNVSFGTTPSLAKYYKIPESGLENKK